MKKLFNICKCGKLWEEHSWFKVNETDEKFGKKIYYQFRECDNGFYVFEPYYTTLQETEGVEK